MLKSLTKFVFVCLLITPLLAESNVIYISVDGLARNTFYALLNRKKLPHFQEIIDRGNYRNMEIVGYPPRMFHAYRAMLSGYSYNDEDYEDIKDPLLFGTSLFSNIKKYRSDVTTVCLLNHPIGVEHRPSLNVLLTYDTQFVDVFYEEKIRSSSDIGSEIASFVRSSKTPFFLFANFTNVDFIARKYREGAAMYSLSIKRCDEALGVIIQSLKDEGIWETTQLVLTTSYGYRSRSQFQSKEIWVAATKKIRFKGSQLDIVPTLYELLGIPWRTIWPMLPGTPLIYNRDN